MSHGGFQLFYDTHSEALADCLADELAVAAGAGNPLVPRTVLVPQLGLERWLTRTLAERHGIAANIEFLPPAKLAWRLLRQWREKLPKRSPFDRDLMQWRLFDLLPQLAAEDDTLAAMLEGRQPELRRLQLAGRLAHLFERYQAYRPDVLEAWEQGKAVEGFQAALWRALVAMTKEAPRSRLMAEYTRHLRTCDTPPEGLPERLFAWGCINISPQVLDLLDAVALHVPLQFFMPTPCGEYWGDLPHRRHLKDYLDDMAGLLKDKTDEPNRLLVSLGGVGREFTARIFTNEALQIESLTSDCESPRDTLLQRLQADIRGMGQPDPAGRGELEAMLDGSIQIHACHSPLREVQVLHDHLLDLLQHDPELEPRDIVVMMPDVGRYAAAVEAVFGALEPDDKRYLPWTVADRARADADPLMAFFLRLLSLPATRLTLDFVLEAMDVPSLRRAVGLAVEDLPLLAEKARQAGIRWGDDAADREAEGLPAFDDFSWAFGRQRLLLGYMLGEEAEGLDLIDGIAPLADLEGQLAQDFGALRDFERRLHALRQWMAGAHSPEDWKNKLTAFVQAVAQPDRDDRAGQRALADIRKALNDFAENAGLAGFKDTLDWQAVRELLGADLANERSGQRYLDGGISVCSMVPMRDVPFKVVCVLGLDADAFPHRDEADVLSLIRADGDAGRRRLGDRSVREDDRYLFLQTLMAARSHLYLSHVGMDLASGKPREPSVVLTELIEHLAEAYFLDPGKARDALVVHQPMHPFSPALFPDKAKQPPLFTYRDEWRQAAGQTRGGSRLEAFVDIDLPPEGGDLARVSLDELKRFFDAPQKAFLQQRAGLVIPRLDETPEREPQVLNHLEQWHLQQAMLPPLLADDAPDPTRLLAAMRARALLPPLAAGAMALADMHEILEPPVREWQAWTGHAGHGDTHSFEMDFDGVGTLYGRIDGVYERGFAGWVGKNGNHKRWFGWWLKALVHAAEVDNPDTEYMAFGIDNGGQPELPAQITMPEPEAARDILCGLLQTMLQGLAAPLQLPPASGWKLAQALAAPTKTASKQGEDAVRKDALKKARKKWADGHAFAAECEDVWLRTVFRSVDPWDAPDTTLVQARTIFLPPWKAMTGVSHDDV